MLGSCCACGKRGKDVRNMVFLNKQAPTPGAGAWGNLETRMDGAVAVVCDHCYDTAATIHYACDGAPGENKRVPIENLSELPVIELR